MLILLFFSTNGETEFFFSKRLQRFNRHLLETVLDVKILLFSHATSRTGARSSALSLSVQSSMRSQAPVTVQGPAVTVGLSPQNLFSSE